MATTTLLNNGASMPLLGFGTGDVGSHEIIKGSVLAAIQMGYRHIDTASLYRSETATGEALAEAFDSGLVRREEMFITSKVWCSEVDDVLSAIKRSLSALKLEYLDLYLIHWPLRLTTGDIRWPRLEEVHPLDIPKTWTAMEECVQLGLTKTIGVSNFSSKKILDLLQIANIVPAVNQVRMNPIFQQISLRKTCKKANIHVSAWSPIGAPNKWWGSSDVIEHPIIKEISIKHGKSPAQVALRWVIEQGCSVLTKSFNMARILENSQIFDWELTSEDHKKIAIIDRKENAPGILLEDGSLYNVGLWDEECAI